MRRSDLVQTPSKGSTPRTTQIVFGERQHLLRVLDSLETTAVPQVAPQPGAPRDRGVNPRAHARTQSHQFFLGRKSRPGPERGFKSEMLDKLEREAPQSDYYLLRLISEHPKVTSKTLARLAKHPYAAIRENVARHPNADPTTLASPGWRKTAASRCGISWPSIPTPPPSCAASCKTACASSGRALPASNYPTFTSPSGARKEHGGSSYLPLTRSATLAAFREV
jgi:hypothetical protein